MLLPLRMVPNSAGLDLLDNYLQAQFQRLRHRRGPEKAICAVAASILTAGYHMLRDGTFYHDLGANHFHRASPEVQATASRVRSPSLASPARSLPRTRDQFLFSCMPSASVHAPE